MVGSNQLGGYKSFSVDVMPTHIKHHRMTRFRRIAPVLANSGLFFCLGVDIASDVSTFADLKNAIGDFYNDLSRRFHS